MSGSSSDIRTGSPGGVEDGAAGSPCPSGSGSGSHQISFVRFNQDVSSLALGSSSGYKLYSLTNDAALEEIHAWPSGSYGTVTIVERFFSSSLLALVTEKEPRKLKVGSSPVNKFQNFSQDSSCFPHVPRFRCTTLKKERKSAITRIPSRSYRSN